MTTQLCFSKVVKDKLLREHQDYKRHISNIINVKSEVDNRRPAGTKFTHMRSKNFKEDFFRKREHLLENNILVTKILKAKVSVEFFNL